MSAELPIRDEEFVLRGGKLDGTIIKEIHGVLPSFDGYHGTGQKDEKGRWILVTDDAGTQDADTGTEPK